MMLFEVRFGLGLQERVKQEFSDAVLHPRWLDLYQQADA